MAALLAEVAQKQIPVWLAIAMAMLPVAVFVFVRPDEMSTNIVRACQTAASLWYFAMAIILALLYFETAVLVRGWPVYFMGLSVGSLPCTVVLWREIRSLRMQSQIRDISHEATTSTIPPLRHKQFAILEAAIDRLLSWARQSNIPLHRVEVVVPFVETDFSLSVWLFYTTDDDLFREEAKGYARMSETFLEILKSLDYPPDWLAGVTFTFNSHEHVERDYQGSYFYRLR